MASKPTLRLVGGVYSDDGDGGNIDGMEARVAKLESSVSHIERDMGELRTDMREMRTDIRGVRETLVRLDERISHMPGRGELWGVGLAIVALLLAALALLPWFYNLAGFAPK